jgi:putative redox protein
MGSVRLVWVENEQFVGIDSSKHSVVLSTQDEANGTGCSPSELLLIALAGCTAVDVVRILKKQRQQLEGLVIEVEAGNEPDPPFAFRDIRMTYRLRGAGLEEKAVARAIELSKAKYCSVAATIESGVPIEYGYVIEKPGPDR